MKRSVFVGAKPTDKNRKKPLKTDKDDLSVYIPGLNSIEEFFADLFISVYYKLEI